MMWNTKHAVLPTKIALVVHRAGTARYSVTVAKDPNKDLPHVVSGGGGRPRALPSPKGPQWRHRGGGTNYCTESKFIVSCVYIILLLYNNIACYMLWMRRFCITPKKNKNKKPSKLFVHFITLTYSDNNG